MDFIEKAEIKLKHWVEHNDQHSEDYEVFAKQLNDAGKQDSAQYVKEMMELTAKSTECLRKALTALK